jgi:uncharacterized membrane protein YhaH (DUF805 family)
MEYYIEVWKKFAVFEGRARRKEYWTFTLVNFLISIILSAADIYLQLGFLDTVYSLAVLIPSLAVAVRRMHDVGKSGWYILIPIYNLILALTEGDKGDNEYGPDPKEEPEEYEEEY